MMRSVARGRCARGVLPVFPGAKFFCGTFRTRRSWTCSPRFGLDSFFLDLRVQKFHVFATASELATSKNSAPPLYPPPVFRPPLPSPSPHHSSPPAPGRAPGMKAQFTSGNAMRCLCGASPAETTFKWWPSPPSSMQTPSLLLRQRGPLSAFSTRLGAFLHREPRLAQLQDENLLQNFNARSQVKIVCPRRGCGLGSAGHALKS